MEGLYSISLYFTPERSKIFRCYVLIMTIGNSLSWPLTSLLLLLDWWLIFYGKKLIVRIWSIPSLISLTSLCEFPILFISLDLEGNSLVITLSSHQVFSWVSNMNLICLWTCRIRFPYPFQWGRPTVNASDVLIMGAAVFVALVEVCAIIS